MSAVAKIGLLAGGSLFVLSAAACSSSDPVSAPADGSAPVVSSAPASTAPPTESGSTTPAGIAPVGPGAPVRADRQLVFATAQSGGRKMLTVGSDGVVALTDRLGDKALFVPSPVEVGGDRYLLKTAKMIEGGEAWCLHVNSPGGGQPLNLKTTACDAGKEDQIFTFPLAPGGKGRLIEVGGMYVFAEGADGAVVVQESGEGDAMSSFTVRDEGKSTIPHLGD
ncbi:hypothetical protein [Actinoplanes regularis]|uniref:Ricin B lectin domain-containing protein n=1 Tax=Actinoplanes regularis TaxID=52697 RepID=A0A238V1U6_9ACTN|nr:hypothetical protein [Actinoplanes regularis]GIE84093.1 hypothetical protein Are01nite_05730 [Actinoplanes regularis]SNR28044.1 hypothetical protein SAMN06264365_101496 [Actinoplanes regularis]